MTLAGLSIRRPITIMMLMISMIFIGLIAMFTMKAEELPNMNIPVATISTTWTGAAPEEVETQVTKKIEEILSNIKGIQRILSTSKYGESTIMVEFNYGIDIDSKVTDLQREISKIQKDLPKNIDTPVVQKMEMGANNLSLIVQVTGSNSNELNTMIKTYLKPRLESLVGVGRVEVFGTPKKQVQIQIDTNKLATFNLSPIELYNLISSSTQNIPLGTLEDGKKKIVARFMGEINYLENLEDIIINSNGNILKLKDIANIVLTTEDSESISYYDGKETVGIMVEKSSDASTIDLNKNAKKVLNDIKSIMPQGTEFHIVLDTSEDITKAISGISSSALQALVLATLVLFIFLKNVRATFLISLTLPVAIIFTFAFLKLNGTGLNLISLMGLSLGIGMLTDNSVVVIDNIYRHITELKSPVVEAADNGTTEVTMSILASSLTTMIVFIPILFIPGIARETFRDLSYSIIFSNLAALLVSLTLMPMLASKFLNNKLNITKEGKIFTKLKEKYLHIIKYAIRYKMKTIIGVGIVFITSVIIGVNFLTVEYMAKRDSGRYSIVAELGKGNDLNKAEEVAHKIENIVKKNKFTQSYFTLIQNDMAAINVDIGKKETRDTTVFEIIEEIREEAEKIPGIRINLSEEFAMESPSRDIEFMIVGPNLSELKEFGKKIVSELSKDNSVVDITSTLDPGNEEARVIINREKIKSYGINPALVGQTINYFILGGDRGDIVKIKTETEEIDIFVRLPKEKRKNINDLMNLNIKIAEQKFIKVSDVANIILGEGASEINKIDRVYNVKIAANGDGVGTGALQSKILNIYKKQNVPSYISYKWSGESENLSNASNQLGKALGISLFLIYALLASQFENLILPLIIIGSIPLALIGVVFGLIVMNQSVDMMCMIGVIMLAGIVVNNAIILIDYIGLLKERGIEEEEAVIEACKIRLRPILMTTMTTILGMFPLSLGIGEGAEIYRGLAITTMFGLFFSTFLTLIVIPILYLIIENLNKKYRCILKKRLT